MPDVIALQEVSPSTVEQFHRKLLDIGLTNSLHSFDLSANTNLPKNRSLGVMIASRFPIIESERANTPWAEKSLSATLQLDNQLVDLHSAYIPPGSSNGWMKIDTIEAVVERVLQPSGNLKILCGDFNCPQKELDDGTIITWGQKIGSNGSTRMSNIWQGQPVARWDDAERSLFTKLADSDIKDVYRQLNGFSADGYSWVLSRKDKKFKRRYDHVFASGKLNPNNCEYLHEPRMTGLSDHSPILVDFNISINGAIQGSANE